MKTPEGSSSSEKVEVNQDILRTRIEELKPAIENFLKRPYLVWTGMPSDFPQDGDLSTQDVIPEVLRRFGPADGTTYSAEELNKKYRNGGMIIQPDGRGGLEAYPVKLEGIKINTALPSLEGALRLNPELARLISGNPDFEKLIQAGEVIGMMRSAPAPMIRLSAIGYPIGTEVVFPGKGAGQRKPAGEDAYLGIGKDKEGNPVYWMINCDKDGLPVNYLRQEDIG